MFSTERSYIVNILTLICVVVFVTVNSNEDDSKEAKLDGLQTGTTENTLLDAIEALKNEEEKDSIPEESEANKEEAEEATEIASVKIEEKVKVDEEIDEGKGTEETVKIELKETVKDEVDLEKEAEEHPELSSEVPKESVSEENIEVPTSALPVLDKGTTIEKEEAPEDTYAVWNSKGKICLLARFNATFSIAYPSKGGEQKAEVHVPGKDGNAKGKCESTTRSPLLQISWQKYALTMMFNKSDENWVVTSVELTYDTSDPLFDRATNDFCSCLSFPFDYA